mgnify:CR=1 FL=1
MGQKKGPAVRGQPVAMACQSPTLQGFISLRYFNQNHKAKIINAFGTIAIRIE